MSTSRLPSRHGCRIGLPHDLKTLHETKKVKTEVCTECGERFRWNKVGRRERIDNLKYLEAHLRNFAQKFGRTKRVYYKIYKPDELIIKL